nr:hypothetical protein [Tanacetum cinerariifolium]
MADKYFAEYTEIKVKQFRETLLQHMSNVKKSVAERTRHQRQYDRRLTESEVQDTSIRSGNDIDNDDAEIRLIYDEEPMAEEQLTIECNIFATRQHHTEQLEIINEASPRSDLRWKRTGKILNTVGLSKYDSHGFNDRVGKYIRYFIRRIFKWRESSCSNASAVTTIDASDKRQQLPDSSSSTSTLATTVTVDENFDV